MGFLLSLFLAVVPMLFSAWVIYWLDRYEKEPLAFLGGVFLWGAIGAAAGAFVVNTLFDVGVYLFTNSEAASELATGSLVAPVAEEALKGLAVLTVFLLAHNEFDSYLDGVVYAGIVALGFAATENVIYIYLHGFSKGGYIGLLAVAFVRIFLVGWQHPFYSAFFGIGLAAARLHKSPALKVTVPLLGLFLGILFHSLHNTIGSLLRGLSGIAVGAVFDWSGWSLMFFFILWATSRERTWIIQDMVEEVELGLISSAQYRTACSAWAQTQARFNALSKGRFRATDRFYSLCGELAQKKHQLRSLGEETGNTRQIERLRLELTQLAQLALA